MIDELENKIEEFKSVLEVLPTKTVDQRKKREKVVLEAEKEALEELDLVKDEINARLSKFDVYKPNPELDKLNK